MLTHLALTDPKSPTENMDACGRGKGLKLTRERDLVDCHHCQLYMEFLGSDQVKGAA